MDNKVTNNRALAISFINNNEKKNIIAAVFDYFQLDCLQRCNINPTQLDKLIREFNDGELCSIEILTSIIDTIKTGKINSSNKEDELIQRIRACVTKHLTDDISIEEMAKELNISYYYICHIFKKKYGISINTLRTQKRLSIAIKKLLESEEKIADIAVLCGFNNISYFTETFTKIVGVSPTSFRARNQKLPLHSFYDFNDIMLADKLDSIRFLGESFEELNLNTEIISVHEPDENFGFLHEAAIIEYHGVLYASWYNCPKSELKGYTPICGKRSYDGGKNWTDLEVICEDKSEEILYCPPVYGICDDTLYMLVNQMVAPDHIHALDLYVLNNKTDKFELLWSKPIPFKLNTNVVTLPNGKLMLPGRIAKLDGFPNTPAVLISDNGKINAEWRLVKVAENGELPDGSKLVHPEISVMSINDTLYMFNRNDQRKVPIVYISKDCGEHWSDALSHDIPYVSSKIYAGNLSDGKKYLISNIDRFDRSILAVYFMDKDSEKFNKRIILFDKNHTRIAGASACHYPAAFESDGKLYIIATLNYEWSRRGAVLFIVDLKNI